jgi:hypothetical protein
MSEVRIPDAWKFWLIETKKDRERPQEVLEERPVGTLREVLAALYTRKIGQLNFYIEFRLERLIPGMQPEPSSGGSDMRDQKKNVNLTKASIVNFPIQTSAQLFVDIIYEYFHGTLGLPRDPITISLFRRQQNYSIEFQFAGYSLQGSMDILDALTAFGRRYQEQRLGAYTDDIFSVEVMPAPRRVPGAAGEKKINMKNTVDSVAVFLKRRDAHGPAFVH